jgi:Cu-Zn family superoxide dismutase
MSVRLRSVSITASLLIALVATGCENMPWNKDKDSDGAAKSPAAQTTAVVNVKPSKAATTQPTLNNVNGTVTFVQTAPNTLRVTIDLSGLQPNSRHGIHIHEKADLSAPDFASAGAHFNPAGHKHGGPDSTLAHAGDLGNVSADEKGNAKAEMTVKGLSLDSSQASGIVGRSLLIHAKEDDLKTDPSGNSGARIAGGVIEMQK